MAAFGADDRGPVEVVKACAALQARPLRPQVWVRQVKFSASCRAPRGRRVQLPDAPRPVKRKRDARRLSRGDAYAYVVRLAGFGARSEEHTSELQSLMRISYAVFCLKKKNHRKLDTVEYINTVIAY